MKEQLIQEQLERSIKLAGVEPTVELSESFALAALGAVAAGVAGASAHFFSSSRMDRVTNAVLNEYNDTVFNKVNRTAQEISAKIKMIKSVQDLDLVNKSIKQLEKEVEEARKKVERIDLDTIISDEVSKQIVLKWGDGGKARVKKNLTEYLKKSQSELNVVLTRAVDAMTDKVDDLARG